MSANSPDPLKLVVNSLDLSTSSGLLSEEDAGYLKSVLQNDYLQSLFRAQVSLEDCHDTPKRLDHIGLCKDIMTSLLQFVEEDSRIDALLEIMKHPHFRTLIEAHDNVLYKTYATPPASPSSDEFRKSTALGPPVRVVGLTKIPGEPLGLTLGKHADNCIYIQRILHGSMVERQGYTVDTLQKVLCDVSVVVSTNRSWTGHGTRSGANLRLKSFSPYSRTCDCWSCIGLLSVGDIIKEINGKPVSGSPEEVQNVLNNCEGSISLRVIPSYKDSHGICQVFVRAHFDYCPSKDDCLPEGESGLAFKKGDILEVVDQSDPNWWQASLLDGDKMGLIPSTRFQQVRRAKLTATHKEGKILGQKKKKIMYQTSKHSMFDRLYAPVYEEITKMPPFERRTIALVGAQHVGRRPLKARLLANYPDRYAAPIPDTSRPMREGEEAGVGYHFCEREEMRTSIDEGDYLEWGVYNDHYYGTRISEVRDIVHSGKVCVIDCNPASLKILKTAEFMPLVVFIEAPSLDVLKRVASAESSRKQPTIDELKEAVRENDEINQLYHHFFDLRIVNEDTDRTFQLLREHIEALRGQAQWVPVSWVF